jgi:hypothetical protein
MRALSKVATAALMVMLLNVCVANVMAQRAYRDSDATIRKLIQRIENRTDNLQRSIENSLDSSRLNGTAREDEINRLVAEFEGATDQLRSRFENRQSTASDAREVLNRATLINTFMINNRLNARAEQDWRLLQSDLDILARSYYVNDWRWNSGTVGGGTGWVDSRQVLARINTRTDRFSRSFRQALTRMRPRNSRDEAEARRQLLEFENAATRLRATINNRTATTADVQNLLNHAAYLNTFLANHQLSGRAETDWTLLRNELDQLAAAHSVTWNWNTNYPSDPGGPVYGTGDLTGTYRLNVSQSGNVRTAADIATRNLPASQRQRAYDSLVRRLDAPDVLAIDRRGTTVTIASTRAPQINFVADGREHVETNENGRTVRVRASIVGDRLSIERTGERAQDFSVTFDPIDNGRRLIVTRRLYSDQLNQPVTVQSYYDRTSQVAQLDLYNGTDYPNVGTVNGDFIVPNNTQLVAVLDSDLSTQNTRENERFTMTVRSPGQFEGAKIEGYVTNVERSGRITGRSSMTFNLDNIRLRDGRSYRFAGIVETVRTPNNEVVRVDNEGSVREDDQTGRTITRTAIGTAVGAIIGAIAGGGKGAAIGAVIGAGAGAGSVYVQGREDLVLGPGTEVTIRSSGPR